ncbi:uncharacterized protein LOC101863914 [Aplysia californica]|uniref:Uncharacterized protein LOC101863914 n=1 Tax=Aplysia californica TaxID=6500 RepID=A0ABM0JWB5_APLCA|nr:uncharacterized protein LOC101863914 [Aplysia californica]
MAESVDLDAKEKAFKALHVLFILAISFSSLALMVKLLRGVLLKNQRKFLIFTLAGGDLFLALFSLTVVTRRLFENNVELSYASKVLSEKYLFHYFPFVHAMGMFVLAIELVHRAQLREIISNPYVASLLCAGLPWVLGLIVVLPLVMDGFLWSEGKYQEGFKNNDRQIAWYVVSTIIPSTLALAACIVTDFINIKWVPEDFSSENTDSATQEETEMSKIYHVDNQPTFYPSNQSHGPFYSSQSEPPYRPNSSEIYAPLSRPPSNHLASRFSMNNNNMHPVQGSPGPLSSRLSMQNVYLPPHPQPDPSLRTVPGTRLSTYRPQNDKSFGKKEKRVLLLVTAISFVLTTPWAFFQVCYVLRDDKSYIEPLAREIVVNWFRYFLYLRSVVTPLIWIATMRKP